MKFPEVLVLFGALDQSLQHVRVVKLGIAFR